jgi:hypothetical protein
MKHISLITVLLLAGVLGQVFAQAPLSITEQAINDLIYQGLPFKGLGTLADFEKMIGKPRSARKEVVANPHNGDADGIHYLSYQGLTLKLYEATRDRRILIEHAEVSSSEWKIASKIQIGSSRTEVERLLGKGKGSTDEWEYGCFECGYPDSIQIRFSRDRVAAMTWRFMID